MQPNRPWTERLMVMISAAKLNQESMRDLVYEKHMRRQLTV